MSLEESGRGEGGVGGDGGRVTGEGVWQSAGKESGGRREREKAG